MPRPSQAKIIIYLLLLLVMESTVVPSLSMGMFRPLFLYLMVLYAAFHWHWDSTLPMALGVGGLLDITGTHGFGIQTASLVGCSFALDFLVPKIMRESFFIRLLTAFTFVLAVLMGVLMISAFLGNAVSFTSHSFWTCISVALSTALIMPVFFFATGVWFGDRNSARQYELFR